jgi:ubiquinone/menaquinone biosynthesis C-methylase UbiE
MTDPNAFETRIKQQMNASAIHNEWEDMYRSADNERFYDLAYQRFLAHVPFKAGHRALDIGCGIGANTVRLVGHGYHVTAADYSEAILPRTHDNMARHGISDRVDIVRQDITKMTLPDGQFDLTLCWGVLMHIPSIVPALDELVRVTKPGGALVFAEVNSMSVEALLLRGLWQTVKRGKVSSTHVPEGIEHRTLFSGEALFWRHINRHWLTQQMAVRGLKPMARIGGHLIESFHYFPRPVAKALSALNRFYVSKLGWAAPAGTNIMIYRKDASA